MSTVMKKYSLRIFTIWFLQRIFIFIISFLMYKFELFVIVLNKSKHN